jgi:hypothetical protein
LCASQESISNGEASLKGGYQEMVAGTVKSIFKVNTFGVRQPVAALVGGGLTPPSTLELN